MSPAPLSRKVDSDAFFLLNSAWGMGKGRRFCRGEEGGPIMRKTVAFLGILFSGIILAGLVRNLTSQENTQQPAALQYEVSVVLKLVHVYVTDKNGKPVIDLTKDDFVLTDNGNPVKLTDFERHILEPSPLNAAPAVLPKTPAEPSPNPMNRKFFLFFDFAYNTPRGITKAKKAALHFVDTNVRPDDEVALLSYSTLKGLTVHQYLTGDRGKIHKVLARIDQKESAGRATEIEDQYWRLVEANDASDPGPMYAASGLREESKRMAETFMLRLTALAKALRLIPGQKQFILFSTGIPNSLINGYQVKTAQFRGDPSDAAVDRVLGERSEEMNREFTASGCTFYTFDTRESAKPAALFAYDEMTFATGSRTMFQTGQAPQSATNVFKDDAASGQNTLKRLSDNTGGKYYSNINLYAKNLEQVQSITGTFYVLGYSIGQHYDGRFHEVKVAVKRPGCVVRAQTGYFAPKPYADYTELEKRLHLFDLALNERSPFRMPAEFFMATLSFPVGNDMRSEVLAKIPGEITQKFTGSKVEFVSIVFDAKGDISDVRRLETDPRPHRGQALLFSTGLALKPGDYDCRIVIRDMQTGLSAVASTRAAFGKAVGSGLSLCTPLILVEETGTPVLDAGPGKKGDPYTWSEIYPFDRMIFSAALGAVSKVHKKLTVVVPYSSAGQGPATVALSVSVINMATGEQMPAAVELMEKSQNAMMEMARFELPIVDLQPGRYLLYIYAEDSVSRSLAHAQTSFVIATEEE